MATQSVTEILKMMADDSLILLGQGFQVLPKFTTHFRKAGHGLRSCPSTLDDRTCDGKPGRNVFSSGVGE